MSKLSERLKKRRSEKKITQQVLADRVGVNRVTYTNWENGNREPELDKIVELATELNTTVDYLIGNSDVNLLDIDTEDLKKLSTAEFNVLVEGLMKNISDIFAIAQEKFELTAEEIKMAQIYIFKKYQKEIDSDKK